MQKLPETARPHCPKLPEVNSRKYMSSASSFAGRRGWKGQGQSEGKGQGKGPAGGEGDEAGADREGAGSPGPGQQASSGLFQV
eukprot:4354987-Alexandrium_andersonii.AAC.1